LKRSVSGECFSDYISDIVAVLQTDYRIDTGCLIEHFFAETLRQATGDDNLSDPAFLFSADGVVYRIERLGFGGGNKTAGVYDDDIGVVAVVGNDEAGLCDLGQHSFAIDYVLGTAESDKSHCYRRSVFFQLHQPI
jgi:hypothetical protein